MIDPCFTTRLLTFAIPVTESTVTVVGEVILKKYLPPDRTGPFPRVTVLG